MIVVSIASSASCALVASVIFHVAPGAPVARLSESPIRTRTTAVVEFRYQSPLGASVVVGWCSASLAVRVGGGPLVMVVTILSWRGMVRFSFLARDLHGSL